MGVAEDQMALSVAAERERVRGPYLVWDDYGYEGWHPTSYPTLEDAVRSHSYQTNRVITKLVEFKAVEVEMALFSKLSGAKLLQPVVYSSAAGTNQAAIISGVNSDGTVSLAYFTAGSTTLGSASNVQFDPTGVTKNPSWRYPEEYF